MDADERLRALKKAYADIILNSAKEAAARIMVSERKALRFQHDLGVAKEQALQMLLRLKLMMDSKVSEAGVTYLSQQREIEELKAQLREAENTMSGAETTSLSQQRKIEELEAQLHEAEDIVKDLREELREVQAELERVRNSKLQQMDEHEIATQEQTSHENRLNSSRSVIFPPPESRHESFTASDRKNPAFNQRNEVYKCYKNLGNSCIGKPNLPSTSKEQRLNTSQSITFPPPESRLEPFTAYDVKNLGFSQRNEVYKCHGANDFNMGNSNVSKPNLPSIILRSKDPGPYRNRRTQRIRAFEEKLMAGELSFSETIDDVNYETSEKEDGGGEGVCKTPILTEKKDVVRANSASYQLQKVKPVRRKRRRFTRYKKTKTLSSGPLYNQALKGDQTSDIPCTEANSVNNNADTGEDPSNMASKLATDTTEKGTPLACTKVTGGYADLDEAVSVDSTTNKDKASTEKLLLTRQESGSSDGSEVPIGRMDVEKVDEPIINSLTKTSCTTNGIPYQPVTDRVIKYTFQRKRKKGSLSSSDGNASLEKSILKKIAVEKQNDPLDSEKSSSITEISRDSRRVAQGARQLVSLSEKKWWQ